MAKLPRIAKVTVEAPSILHIDWKEGGTDTVDLAGWIADGRSILAGLGDPAVFGAPRLIAYDSAVEWGEDNGDLAIDARHLKLLSQEQRPFAAAELVAWQARAGMSNAEAADFLGVVPSTYSRWKAGHGTIPTMVAMVCRASLRDRLMISAHLRPRRPAGRPRNAVA